MTAVSRSERRDDAGVRWWRGDLAEQSAVQKLLRAVRPDVVFHLAGEVTGARDLDLVPTTFRGNLMGAVNMLTAAVEADCPRLVLAGSMEEPEPGDAEAVAASPYAVAKWAATGYGRMFHALYGLPVVHLRIFMVYGPGQHDLRKLVPYATVSMLKGEAPRLMSGRRLVDWVYVDDVVDGLLTAARAEGIDGRSIDIGTGRLFSVRAVVERLARVTQSSVRPCFGAIEDRRLEPVRVARPDDSRAAMGWSPVTSLDQGLVATVDWYRSRLASLALGSAR